MIKSDSVEAQRSTYYKPMCLLKSSFLHVIIKTPPSNKKIHQSIRAARVSLHVKKVGLILITRQTLISRNDSRNKNKKDSLSLNGELRTK